MAEEVKKETESTEVVKDDAVDIIKNLKETTVSKDMYNKLQADHNKLLKALAEGQQLAPQALPKPTEEQLKKQYEDNCRYLAENGRKVRSNLQHAKKLIEIEDYRKSHDMPSMFLPQKGTPTADDVAAAEMQESIIRYAIEECQDSEKRYNAIIDDCLKDNIYIRSR